LRSIEQNELAIITDAQNKAILLFTGVTIIFLPLSFFTSYFGMNLDGIVNTSKNEAYFWKACGSFSLIFILVISAYGFRQSLLSRFLHLQRHVAPRT
jgi:Mg2+ and Co2+ transporter CorA